MHVTGERIKKQNEISFINSLGDIQYREGTVKDVFYVGV